MVRVIQVCFERVLCVTQVLSVVVQRLIHQRVLYNREVTSLSKFLILKAREAFRQNPPESLPVRP